MLQAGAANRRVKGSRDRRQALCGQLRLVPQPHESQASWLGRTPYRGRIPRPDCGPCTAPFLSAWLQAETQHASDEGDAVARPEYRRPRSVPGVRGEERSRGRVERGNKVARV